MSSINRFGLTRVIPAEIKRKVRQGCGFGCVVCGKIGMEYDHFSPEFVDCERHDAAGIALLCSDCHTARTAGRLSPERVRDKKGKAVGRWKNATLRTYFGSGRACIGIGSSELVGPHANFRIGELELLKIVASNSHDEPWTLSGKFFDGAHSYLMIEDNEVSVSTGSWDVQLEGRSLKIRRSKGCVALHLQMTDNRIHVMRLDLKWEESWVKIDHTGQLKVSQEHGGYSGIEGISFHGFAADLGRSVLQWNGTPADVARAIAEMGATAQGVAVAP